MPGFWTDLDVGKAELAVPRTILRLLGGGFARLALLGWGEKALLLAEVVLGLQLL